ncbi:MAG: heme biosynthesis HemY N-terminal domain-containing protein [Amphiplicatus sp.]
MLRVLIFIISAVFLAYVFTVFLSMGGRLEAVAFGQRFDIQNGVAALLLLLSVGVVAGVTGLLIHLYSLPAKIKRRAAQARNARGLTALVRGLEAAAMGDAASAQQQARIASRNLDDVSHTRLLTAQAAQLSGDEKLAGETFTTMLEAPDTEFLGLRGLYAQAMRAGDKGLARSYAERAFRLRSNTGWAFESVLDLGLERGAWGETREAVRIARKNGLLAEDKGKRGEAALLAADAYAAEASGDWALAVAEADASIKLAPGFAPAAALAARLHAEAGKKGKAAKILETAFSENPHPAVARVYNDLYADEQVEKRAEQMKRLAERQLGAREAQLLLARRAVLLGDHAEAIAILEPLLIERANARDCALMAEAVAGAYAGQSGEALARPWLKRAASAPRDSLPGAEGSFHFTRDGWARLVREYMDHGRLAPPPLEDAPPGLSQEELKLLTAPAIIDAPPVETPGETDASPPVETESAPVTAEKTEADHEREIDAARKVS